MRIGFETTAAARDAHAVRPAGGARVRRRDEPPAPKVGRSRARSPPWTYEPSKRCRSNPE
jgi:hypothetical protein